MPWILRRKFPRASDQIINFPSIVHIKNILTPRMQEILINVIHTVINQKITNSQILEILKLLNSFQQTIIYLLVILIMLVGLLVRIIEDDSPCL
jgi:hypothetical protein